MFSLKSFYVFLFFCSKMIASIIDKLAPVGEVRIAPCGLYSPCTRTCACGCKDTNQKFRIEFRTSRNYRLLSVITENIEGNENELRLLRITTDPYIKHETQNYDACIYLCIPCEDLLREEIERKRLSNEQKAFRIFLCIRELSDLTRDTVGVIVSLIRGNKMRVTETRCTR